MKFFWAKEIEHDIARLRAELPHALLLTGPDGVGLTALARHLADIHLSGIIEPTDAKGEVDRSSSGVVRVTQVRDLLSHAINKTRSRRVYIIDDADRMNHQAQNAFLKLLEEPAPHVHFILVSHHAEQLLPTVRSRVQLLRVPPISHDQSLELLHLLHITDETARIQLLFLADGLPAELSRLAADPALFAHKAETISAARQFLQGTLLEKLQVVRACSTNRADTLEMLTYAERILRHSLGQHPTAQLIARADEIGEAYDRIAANGYIRIQLLRLVV